MGHGPSTPLVEFHSRKEREKGAGKALCATAYRLLTIIFVVLKKQLDYWYLEDPLYKGIASLPKIGVKC